MTRLYKQAEHRGLMPRRPKIAGPKTGAKKDNLPQGYKEHPNAVEGDTASQIFVPKIR
ncbi:MAG: hypothetical protein ACI9S8_001337 [Chlamydiales bacterium]|jgi:hypothetical protein